MADEPEKARRRSKAQLAAARLADEQARVVRWADEYGAPVRILEGWDPATGEWEGWSPVGQLLRHLTEGNFISVAANRAQLHNISQLVAKGGEYAVDVVEEREYIPIAIRPFIDLVRGIEIAEATAEMAQVRIVVDATQSDPRLAMAFLGRRFGARWREQQSIFTGADIDDRDRAVSAALSDPNLALKLGEIAHTIEDASADDEA